MKNFFKRLFGKKEKPKEEEPLLTNDDKQSVPNEIVDEKFSFGWRDKYKNEEKSIMENVQPEEPIAPTLERQEINLDDTIENVVGSNDNKIPEPIMFTSIANRNLMNEILKEKLSKNKKPKKQAIKKDKFNDDASKPKGRNFLM